MLLYTGGKRALITAEAHHDLGASHRACAHSLHRLISEHVQFPNELPTGHQSMLFPQPLTRIFHKTATPLSSAHGHRAAGRETNTAGKYRN